MAGFVYIAENDSMEGIVKIGKTARHPNERLKELQTTGVPTPFRIVVAYFCFDPEALESSVHNSLSEFKVSSNREFFNCSQWLAVSEINKWFAGGVEGWKQSHESGFDRAIIGDDMLVRVREKIGERISNDVLNEIIDSMSPTELKLLRERVRNHHRVEALIHSRTMESKDE